MLVYKLLSIICSTVRIIQTHEENHKYDTKFSNWNKSKLKMKREEIFIAIIY